GEITQMFSGRGVASRENYFERIYAKTASMFELASSAPVFLAGFGEETFEALRTYGYEIGMAFQIMDDILDFVSHESNLGKPVASDLRNGLVTLPALCHMELVPGAVDVLLALANGRTQSEAEVDQLIHSIRASGAIDMALDEATAFVERGLQSLDAMPLGSERNGLEELARFVVSRAT
ncbi:MAG: polyprenyl synthetase family protein, partial [Chloroflexi bacterium]|nr:polyprenyl synthetase family protein [Chloroflexota bacterium]